MKYTLRSWTYCVHCKENTPNTGIDLTTAIFCFNCRMPK